MSVKSMHAALMEMAQNQSEAVAYNTKAAKSRLDDRRETNSRMLKRDFNKSGISHIHSTKTGPDGSKYDHFDIGKHTKVISTHNSYKVLHKGKETHYQGDPEHRDNRNRVIDKVLQHVGKNESVERAAWVPESVELDEAKEVLSNFMNDRKKEQIISLAKQKGLKVKDMGDKIEVSGPKGKVADMIAIHKPVYVRERAAWVPESIADEQVEAFMEATVAAVAEGKDTFVFEGKHYKAKTKKEDKLDPVGQEDDDIDNDGDVDSSDKYLKKRRSAIAKRRAMDEEKIDEISRDKQDASYTDRYATGGKDTAAMQKRRKAAIQKAADRFKKTGSYTGKKESVEESIEEAKEVLSRFGSDKLKQNMINLAQQKGLKVKDMGDKIEVSGAAKKVMDLTLAAQKSDVKVEQVEESARTAQHGPDDATSDTFQKQMGGGRSPREKEFVDMHKMEVGLDVNKIHDDNKKNIEAGLKASPARMGDNLKNGDTSFVSPLKADIIDGITKALQQMKTNS